MKKSKILLRKSSQNKDKKPQKKKALGQHFLRKKSIVFHMIDAVTITPKTSILEIGCGDGFITKIILEQTPCKQLLCYEIDSEWATYVREKIKDKRLIIKEENILDANLSLLEKDKPWVILSNLPYQITFPVLFILQENKNLFEEGVVIMQEEVGQKIVAKRGKNYSATSLFLQYHFEWKLMEKIEPTALSPPPKVYSRLLYFKPRIHKKPILNEDLIWKFIKICFKSPRRTLHNNLKQTNFDITKIKKSYLEKRAQQLSFEDFIILWELLENKG